MSLHDWTQYLVGTPGIEIDFLTPLRDAGSLHLTCAALEKVLLLDRTVYTPGLLKGRIQSLFQVEGVTGSGTSSCGFTLFQSTSNVVSTGVAYQYGITLGEDLEDTTLFFALCTTGINGGLTSYFTGTPFSRINGTTIIALEIEWAYEPILLGGTRFILREGHGLLDDFSNLMDQTTLHVYPGTPPLFLETSMGEGLFAIGGLSTTLDLTIDRTTITALR